MMKTVYFIILTIFNPNVGEFGEASISQYYHTEIGKKGLPIFYKHYKSYDECKSKLYKIMEQKSDYDWKMRKSGFEKESIVLQRMSGNPSKRSLKYYTCEQFRVDKNKL